MRSAAPRSESAVREGLPLVAALAAAGALTLTRSRPAGALLLGVTVWAAWFFRDPERLCPAEAGVLYSAADGRVMSVEEVDCEWHLHGRALRIAVFLSPLDVHVNRSPVAARLVASRRDPGPFAPAFLVGHSDANARQLLGLEVDGRSGPGGKMVVTQIVGFMARRIVSWRLPGDHLDAGEKLGMIRLGSRTDVLLPLDAVSPLVRAGDRVFAGVTPVARYR